ncbi:MAG: hypothetical protein DHS20C21_03220 [Gemmatimonadota bacterium]|nr:MAG: hypothetical protein DHS20C21_03220 [Gemmatimonadota bacterium]
MSSLTEPLVALGFTQLEADVYSWLLEESPATGYRIGQALRKPAPNIYKALESLEAKGAVMVDEGRSRQCSPVPPDELLAHLDRRFQEDRQRAHESLSRRVKANGDERIYRLQSRDAVLARARGMLERAREVAIVDGFPGPLQEIAPDLEAAARRGVRVAALSYAPAEVAGVEMILHLDAANVLERWPTDWLNLVVDGAEYVVSNFEPNGGPVRQAIWSESVYLSWVYHSSLSAELILCGVEAELKHAKSLAPVRKRLRALHSLRAVEAPGYHNLRKRHDSQGTAP